MNKSEKKFISLIVVILLFLFFLIYFIHKEACNQKSISFDGHKFGIISGCMVKYHGAWLPLENIRGFGGD